MTASVGEKAPGFTLPTERREHRLSLDNTNGGRPETVRAEPQRTAFPFLAGFDRLAMEDHGVTGEDRYQERICVIDREEMTTLEAVLEALYRVL